MQFRMSPGGRIRFSRRSRPELPPSSVTVTIAAMSAMGRSSVGRWSFRRTTCSFKPRKSAESPVPPPSATTCRPRKDLLLFPTDFFTRRSRSVVPRMPRVKHPPSAYTHHGRADTKWRTNSARLRQGVGWTQRNARQLARVSFFFRIQQFGEARVFLKEGKILVVTGVVAVCRAEFNGDL